MGREMVPETSEFFNQLTRAISPEASVKVLSCSEEKEFQHLFRPMIS